MRLCCSVLFGLTCLCGCKGAEAPDTYSGKPPADAGTPGVRTLDRSSFADVGTGDRLDYSVAEHWVCRPDIEPNECARNIDATEVRPDGSFEVRPHVMAEDAAFDCFYVYPTVWISRTARMRDFSDSGVKLVLDPLLAQAAPFTSLCRMYAPLYRQVGLSLTGLPASAGKQQALQDVRDAFAHYLEHDNHGRKFVLLGHSQGAYVLTTLISKDIDDDPELRARMISAVLLGAQPYAAAGERVGGSFKNIPSCSEPGETGCVIAYNSFAAEAPPTASAALGRVTTLFANEPVDTTGQVFCTEPAALAGRAGRYQGSYFPQTLNNAVLGSPTPIPGVATPFVLYRDLFRGHCVQKDGLSYLELALEPAADEKRPLPTYRNPLLEAIGMGTHYVDYGVALDDLLEAVRLQAQAVL